MRLKLIPVVVLALAAAWLPAHAQFTAAVVPPQVNAKVDTSARKDSVRRATIALAARVSDMKRWVDSAAGVPVPPAGGTTAVAAAAPRDSVKLAPKDSVVLSRDERVREDSATSIATVEVHDSTGMSAGMRSDTTAPPARPVSAREASAETTQFASGVPAPATATELPLLALAGVFTLLAGIALRRP